MNKTIALLIITSLIIGFSACKTNNERFNNAEYQKSISLWKQKRLENLKSEKGWLNLVGLHWLNEGKNTFGSDTKNNIVFPDNAPKSIGSIFLFKEHISIKINADIDVFINDSLTKQASVYSYANENTTHFKLNSFKWYIIKRGNRYGIRLRDLESPLISKINEIPAFPVDCKWRIKCRFEKFDTPEEIEVPNVLGESDTEKCYGLLKFEINGKEHALRPLGDGINQNFFVIFADATSTIETYGTGRFLSVEKPNKKGITYIDFNKATNPPCAFTQYATCPLPPKGNILTAKITAGEKTGPHIGHH